MLKTIVIVCLVLSIVAALSLMARHLWRALSFYRHKTPMDFWALVFCAGIVCLAAGCSTIETKKPDGTVITEHHQWLTNKVLAGAGSVQAVKIEPAAGSTSSGTPMINATIGGANSAAVDAPKNANKRVIAYSKSMSFLGSITSAGASGVSWTYISTEDESATDTAKVVESMSKISTDTANSKIDTSTSTDTGVTSK